MVYRPQIISHDLKRPISIAVLDNWVEIPVPSPKKVYLREVLFHYFNMKYTVYQSYNILLHIYGDQSLGIRKCYKWHKQFKSRNFDFVVEKQAGPPKKFEDVQLKVLLIENHSQTQEILAKRLNVTQRAISHRLKALGFIRRAGKWIPSTTSTIGKI